MTHPHDNIRVTLMGFTPTHLSLAIGMLNGVFKER